MSYYYYEMKRIVVMLKLMIRLIFIILYQ